MVTTDDLTCRSPSGGRVDDLREVPAPRLVIGHVRHRRFVGRADSFRFRSLHWLVDIDRIPTLTVGRREHTIHPTDHLAGNGLRTDLGDVLDSSGLTLNPHDRVLMLAQPRIGGYVFDPLTVYWCGAADGTLRAIVLEVHNTYGGRHTYVLPGASRRHTVDKTFYVSPFNDTRGQYQVFTTLAAGSVHVSVNLHRDGNLVLAASVDGDLLPLDRRTARTANRYVRLARRRVPLLIRWRALLLIGRGLRRHPRPNTGGNVGRQREQRYAEVFPDPTHPAACPDRMPPE